MKKVIVPPQRIQTHERVAPVPYMVWAVLFTVVPLLFIAYYAFTDNQFRFTFDNITRFFTATSTMETADGAQRGVSVHSPAPSSPSSSSFSSSSSSSLENDE